MAQKEGNQFLNIKCHVLLWKLNSIHGALKNATNSYSNADII